MTDVNPKNMHENLQPVTLIGAHVRLEPLRASHAEDLLEAILYDDLWNNPYISVVASAKGAVPALHHIESYIQTTLEEQEAGVWLPFAIIHKASGKAIGSTRFGNIVMEHKRLEIGWTWLHKAHHRTAINTEMKFLLLGYAFETLGCNRVELKTNSFNFQSRRAMERMGATFEGILRQHMIFPTLRDTAYFSITTDEWSDRKKRLEAKLYDYAAVVQSDTAKTASQQTTIEIFRADTRHLDALVPLFDGYRQFYKQPSDVESARRFLTERLVKQESVVFLAMLRNGNGNGNDSVAAGFVQLFPSFSSVSMRRLWILNDLFVAPEAREHSVAQRLMATAEEFAANDNAKGLVLSTAADNVPAQKLYEKRGWKRDTEFYTYERYL
jgi:N-acetyltransferase